MRQIERPPALCALFVGLLLFGTLGCSDSPVDSPLDPESPPDPWLIGPDGGTVVHEQSGFTIDVPPGALRAPIRLSLSRVPDGSLPADPGRAGDGWVLGPPSLLLEAPITLGLPLPTDVEDENSLILASHSMTGLHGHPEGRRLSDQRVTGQVATPGVFWATRGWGLTRRIGAIPERVRLEVGEEVEVNLEGYDLGGRRSPLPEVTWTLGDTLVAHFAGEGRVLGRAPGRTQVRVHSQDGMAEGRFSVDIDQATPRTLEWLERPDTLVLGEVSSFSVAGRDARGNPVDGVPVRWETDDGDILEFSGNGQARGLSVGETTVHARVSTPGDVLHLETQVVVKRLDHVGLSSVDREALTEALSGLYEVDFGSPWVAIAESILQDRSYTGEDWLAFFREYFATHKLNWNLHWYLRHTTHHWEGWNREGLQEGIIPVLLEHLDFALELSPQELAARSASSFAYRQHLYYTTHMLALYLNQDPGMSLRERVAEGIRDHVGRHPRFYDLTRTVSGEEQWLVPVRTQVAVTLAEAAEDFGWAREEVIHWLGLDQDRARIYRESGTLLNDNGLAGPRQLLGVRELLASIPPDILNLVVISINDFLYQGMPIRPDAHVHTGLGLEGHASTRAGVNIFGLQVGAIQENPFPDDVPPHPMDVFMAVVAHEVNHVVDCCAVRRDPFLRNWMWRLLAEAGDEPQNFLRSMFEPGFFTNVPQEFFASISNQWFGHSRRTLELGFERWRQGTPHPLHQALFMAEVYSLGGNATVFYQIDLDGELTREVIPLRRDDHGYIHELHLDDEIWRFYRSADGSVIGWEAVGG